MDEKNKNMMSKLIRMKNGNTLKKWTRLKISRTNIFDKKIMIDDIQIM